MLYKSPSSLINTSDDNYQLLVFGKSSIIKSAMSEHLLYMTGVDYLDFVFNSINRAPFLKKLDKTNSSPLSNVVSPDTCVLVKEWAAYKGKSPHTPELVEALPFREWTCPNLKKLWLGKAVEDKNRRMRAFLACMRSDTPAMLNPANVPTPLLVLCCVLR